MKIYVTHHGQVDAPIHEIPHNAPITELGRLQAEYLGRYLKHMGFCGKIYSSPYACALETAEIVAAYTGSQILEWEPMGSEENINRDSEKLQSNMQSEFEKLSLQEDALFVVLEKTHEAFGKALGFWANRRPCNCSLSIKDFDGKVRSVYGEAGHMPYKMQGYNMAMKSCADKAKMDKYMEEDICVLNSVIKEQGVKVLHISDTASYTYPYVEKMIEKIKPDIIIHTGDFVDEVKAGRIPGTRDEYESGLKIICKILNDSGAEVYGVCGNNDIPELVKKYLPDAHITETADIVDICGVDCLLTHSPEDVTGNAQWSFYGHGLGAETWSKDKNDIINGVCRFNAIWHFSVIIMPQRKLYAFGHPATRKQF